MNTENIGILASMSWNSNKWQKRATEEDIVNSKYDYVKQHGWMHEDLNFAIDDYPHESDGTFIAYTPMFNKFPSAEKSKHVEIVFFRSLNYHNKQNYIVGFYAFPEIDKFPRTASHQHYKQYDYGNVKSRIEDIVFLENPVLISDEIASKSKYLPEGKKLGQQGFNYMNYENVMNILKLATHLNPDDSKLINIVQKLSSN